jgi:hypothetical protein
MSLLSDYIAMHGVSVTWKHKTGNDGDDDIFTTSTISVLWAFGAKTVRTVRGDELACQAICKCEAAVEAGDTIAYGGRDYPVLGLVGAAYDGQ